MTIIRRLWLTFGVIFLLLTLTLSSFAAATVETAAPVADIQDYKNNYRPQEYHPESLSRQIVDVIMLATMLTAAVYLSKTGKPRSRNLLILSALLYFGLWRGGCICPVGAISNVVLGIVHPEEVGRITAITFLLPLIFALFAGRIFCSSACPLGACQHFTTPKKPPRLPTAINLLALITAPLVLILTVGAVLHSSCFLICWLDPYKPLFFTGHEWARQLSNVLSGQTFTATGLACGLTAWLILIGVVLLSCRLTRPFCRFVCPYGVLLGIFSLLGFRRRKIDRKKCISCGQCAKVCPVQAIGVQSEKNNITVSNYSCLQCDRCCSHCPHDAIE